MIMAPASGFLVSSTALAAILVFSPICRASEDVQSILPPFSAPKMQFNTGRVVDGKPEFESEMPSVTGDASSWQLLQWRKEEYLRPSQLDMTASYGNSVLGRAAFRWTSPVSDFNVYRNGATFVYEMVGKDGFADSSGGSDIMVSSRASAGSVLLDHKLTISFQARVSIASVVFANNEQAPRNSHDVLGEAGAILRTHFTDPSDRRTFSVMLGIPVANSNDSVPNHLACHYFGSDRLPQIVANTVTNGNRVLAFKPSHDFTQFSVNVGSLVQELVGRSFPCKRDDGTSQTFEWPNEASHLGNWYFDSISIGVETHNKTKDQKGDPVGHVELGIAVKNIQGLYKR